MKLVALDISTNTGFAVYVDGKLVGSGTLWPDSHESDFGTYPNNYVDFTRCLAGKIFKEVLSPVLQANPGGDIRVVIEETTASQNNYAQKKLEFLHFQVLEICARYRFPVVYIRDGVWKRIVGATQNKEERNLNAKIARIKKKTGAKLAKIDGKVVGKKNRKDYAIRAANEIFGKSLKKNDSNEADAILLGYAYLKGAPACDGTTLGGLLPKADVV